MNQIERLQQIIVAKVTGVGVVFWRTFWKKTGQISSPRWVFSRCKKTTPTRKRRHKRCTASREAIKGLAWWLKRRYLGPRGHWGEFMLFKTMGFFDMRKKWGCWKMLGWNQHLNQKKNPTKIFREVEVMARQMGDLLWQRDVPPPDFSVPRLAVRKATVDGSEIPNNQMTWCDFFPGNNGGIYHNKNRCSQDF